VTHATCHFTPVPSRTSQSRRSSLRSRTRRNNRYRRCTSSGRRIRRSRIRNWARKCHRLRRRSSDTYIGHCTHSRSDSQHRLGSPAGRSARRCSSNSSTERSCRSAWPKCLLHRGDNRQRSRRGSCWSGRHRTLGTDQGRSTEATRRNRSHPGICKDLCSWHCAPTSRHRGSPFRRSRSRRCSWRPPTGHTARARGASCAARTRANEMCTRSLHLVRIFKKRRMASALRSAPFPST
jgi:hypothetical protein